jgi:phytoene dehydrogenase-like protein
MDESPRWVDSRLDDVIYTHITSGLNGVSRNFNETARHLLPADPVVGVGTPTLLDPSRAPEGKAVVVLQVLDVPYTFTADAAGEIDVGDGTWSESVTDQFVERVFGIVSQHVKNIPDAILAKKVLTPRDLEAANPNWVHGDPYSGSHDISQSFLMRPFAGKSGHGSPVKNLFTIGAATHPGLGLGSNSGFIVAKQLLQDNS